LGDKWQALARQAGWTADTCPRQALMELLKRIGLPTQLQQLGVAHEALQAVAAQALEDNAHKTNPRAITQADYLQLLEDAY
jgi:alcohol dehydrogenase class IV